MAQQTPAQREQVRQLQPGAVASWWQPGHPGWAIYPVDSEQFMSTGALENVNVTNEQIVAPLPMGCEFSPAFKEVTVSGKVVILISNSQLDCYLSMYMVRILT